MRDRSRWFFIALLGFGVAFATPTRAQTPSTIEMKGAPLGMLRMTLAQAVQRSLARNPSVVIALEEIRRYEAIVRETRSLSLPTLAANGIYTRLDADRTFGGRTILAKDQLSANITLAIPLIVPQRWAAWSHAAANVKTTEAVAEDVKRQMAITVARAFLAVIAQKHVVDVNEHALKTARAHYDFAHTRLQGGLGNKVDDVRAEQQVATNESTLESSYAALVRAREGLGLLLGTEGPVDAIEEMPLPPAPSLEVALDEATRKRSDVAAGKARLDAAEQVRKDGYTDYLPFLLGTVQPFYQTPESLTQPTTGWQAQLLLTLPLYDGGLRYGLAAERQSLSTEARAQYDYLVRQARSDVRIAFDSVKQAEAAYQAAVNAARLAHEAVDLATMSYRAGATTNLEVIDAERAAHAADTAAAVAEDQAGQARIDLLAASGRFP